MDQNLLQGAIEAHVVALASMEKRECECSQGVLCSRCRVIRKIEKVIWDLQLADVESAS